MRRYSPIAHWKVFSASARSASAMPFPRTLHNCSMTPMHQRALPLEARIGLRTIRRHDATRLQHQRRETALARQALAVAAAGFVALALEAQLARRIVDQIERHRLGR